MQFFRKDATPTLRHLLTVNDSQGVQTFLLDASMYSIGRDLSNAIVIHAEGVSRQHAILLRTPAPDKQYHYVLQDGNVEGKPSAHGTFVNGIAIKKHSLKDGDKIDLGGKASLIYRTVLLSDQELEHKVTVPEYRKLKENVLTAAQTIQIADQEETAEDATVAPDHGVTHADPHSHPHLQKHLHQEIALFKDCYETVVHELKELQLTPKEYALIAIAIYQQLRAKN
jgi:pSer/pThr/pTyr-binding forkhead associated (FHA) protein